MLTLTFVALCLVTPFAVTRIAVLVLARRYPPTGSFQVIDGIRLHVVDRPATVPDGPALICIHGASGTARDPLSALGPALDGRYRLVALDRPGHGHSGAGDREMSDPRRQADLVAGLCARIGVGRAIIVGHSWGGAVAAAFAVRHAAQTAGLVLVAPATHPWPGGIGFRHRLFAHPYVGVLFSEMLAIPVGLLLVGCALRTIFRPDPVPEGYRTLIGAAQALRPRSFRANSRDIANFYRNVVSLSQSYHKIAAPTAIVTGDSDRIVARSIHAYGLARDIAGSTLAVIGGAGHMPHWSATEAVIAAIDSVAGRAAAAATAGRRAEAAE